MNRRIQIVICAISLICISSCTYFKQHYRYSKQAQYHLQQEEYRPAVEKSIAALERDVNHGEARETLVAAYQSFTADFEVELEKMPNGTTAEKEARAKALSKMDILNTRIDELERQSSAFGIAKVDYEARARASREEAKAAKYSDAEELMQFSDRNNTIAAAKMFKQLSGYSDASKRYEVARKKAMRSYVFIPFQNRGNGQNEEYDFGAMISEKLSGGLRQDSEFIEFNQVNLAPAYSDGTESNLITSSKAMGYAKELDSTANFAVYGYVERVTVGAPKITKEVKEHKRDEKISSGKVDGKKVTKTREIKGKATHYTRTATTNIQMKLAVVDLKTGVVRNEETVSGIYVATNNWVRHESGNINATKKVRSVSLAAQIPIRK